MESWQGKTSPMVGNEIEEWKGKTLPKGSKGIEVGGKEIEGWQGKTSPMVSKEIEGWERKTSLKRGKEIVAGKEQNRKLARKNITLRGERYRAMGRINIELGAVDIDSRQTLT